MKPDSLPEVLELLERYGEDASVLAGGQSLMRGLDMRLSTPKVLIEINGRHALSGIRVAGDTITIGALTRHREVEHSDTVARHLPLLSLAMRLLPGALRDGAGRSD